MGRISNPLYLLGPPLLLLISFPLALFAIITTAIALSTLAVRVSIVYFELGIALIHAYLFPPPQKAPPKLPSPGRSSPNRSRTRRSSVASATSSQDTAIPHQSQRLHNKSGSFASLVGTSEITRDFEGVGGWRVPADEEEEALWMGMNSRLELPAVMPNRKHQRSLTGGSQRFGRSPEAIRMSPMQSRSRTPVQTDGYGDEYFPMQPTMRPLSSTSDLTGRIPQDGRRKSVSGSSTSSKGSYSRHPGTATKICGE